MGKDENIRRVLYNIRSDAEKVKGKIVKRIAVCIPTFCGGKVFRLCAVALSGQEDVIFTTLAIDSGSNDETVRIAQENGFTVLQISAEEFNHGATRQRGVALLDEAEIIVFLTQDAVLADKQALARLAACFDEPDVGLAYGRQMPRSGAGAIEAHARFFNYPEKSRLKSKADIADLGIKAAFASNSFAAYRRSALMEAGGFPGDVILGEDMAVAAKMLLAGWRVAYCAEARVFHSHDYTLAEEFRRYFDIGVFHAQEKWLLEKFGKSEGEGLRFIRSEMAYLVHNGCASLLPQAFLRTLLKYAGYRLGGACRVLPLCLKRRWSMHKRFWR